MENKTKINVLGTMEELFNAPKEFVAKHGNYYNCIYAWILEGEVCYVGQAKDFMSRHRCGTAQMCHYDHYIDIKGELRSSFTKKYNGLRKHGLSNISVGIVASDLNTSDLSNEEIHYIAEYHTCHLDKTPCSHPWNLNFGGEDNSHLLDPEVVKKATKTRTMNGDYDSSNPNSAVCRGIKTKKSLGQYSMDSANSSVRQMNSIASVSGRIITKSFTTIGISLSVNSNPTWNEFVENLPKGSTYVSISTIIERLSSLRSDSRWTSQLESLFTSAGY